MALSLPHIQLPLNSPWQCNVTDTKRAGGGAGGTRIKWACRANGTLIISIWRWFSVASLSHVCVCESLALRSMYTIEYGANSHRSLSWWKHHCRRHPFKLIFHTPRIVYSTWDIPMSRTLITDYCSGSPFFVFGVYYIIYKDGQGGLLVFYLALAVNRRVKLSA